MKRSVEILVMLGAAVTLGCDDGGGGGEDPIVIGGGDMAPEPDSTLPDAGPDPDAAPEPDMAPEPECSGDPSLQPPRLNEHVAAWDPDGQKMIVFGGNTAVPENCGFPAYTFESTTWIYDPAAAAAGCPPWIEQDGGPPGRTRAAATWGGGAMWVYGGRFRNGTSGPYQVFGDLWRYDPEAGTWTEIEQQGERPRARFNASLVWDSTRQRLMLYAGNGSGAINPTVLDDLWAFDPATGTWSELQARGEQPSRRMWHAALYDESRDRMVIYGGGDETAFFDNAQYFDEVYALDMGSAAWTTLHPGGAGAPDGRFWAGLVHDTVDDVYVMFAGHDDAVLGNRNDLWIFDPADDTWSNPTVGDLFNRPANGFCDFPPDFTTVQPGTPERRNAHTVVWDGTQLVTFGGKTDCGASNDVWHWSAEAGWTNPVIATEGEMCVRWRANPDNCVNMCF